jgi:hypothetical protein
MSALVWLAMASTVSGVGSAWVLPIPALSEITTR